LLFNDLNRKNRQTAGRIGEVRLGGELPPAIKIVGWLYNAMTLKTRIIGGISGTIGPIVPTKDALGQLSSAFLVGNPCAALANMILLVTCQIMPPQKPGSGLIFQLQ
jgi:hypothetical protein